jgi:Domain of unknown function (DUF4190)/Septum formation
MPRTRARHAASSMPPSASEYRQPPASTWAEQAEPPPTGTDRMAVTSFVLGLLGIVGISAILGIGLGIAALRRMRGTLQQGRGLAIAGIVLGSAWLVVIVALYATGTIFGTATPRQPAASGSTGASSQGVDPFSLAAGDCFDNPVVAASGVTNVSSVVETSCTKPHNAEVFATFAVTGSSASYPGTARLTSIATSGCNAREKAALNSALITKSMTVRLLFPLQSSWKAGHRTISCIIYSPTSNLKSSVLKP